MISYELAKKLKDAGFPQPESKNYDCWILTETYGSAYYSGVSNDIEPYLCRFTPGMTYTRWHIWVPTLSELIEACEDDFLSLKRYKAFGGTFCATSKKVKEEYLEPTPEEAVALLWLALNKL